MNINAFVEKANGHSFSCCAEEQICKTLLVGYGKTASEAIDDFYVSYEELKQMDGDAVPPIDVALKFDVGSLFSYYSFLNIEGIAKLSGISPSVLRQYASGVRTPKDANLKLLEEGLRKAAENIGRVMLCA